MLGLVRHQAQASDPQILDNRACRPQRPACNFCNAQSGSSRGDRRVTVAVQPEPQRHPPSPASVPDRTEAREPPVRYFFSMRAPGACKRAVRHREHCCRDSCRGHWVCGPVDVEHTVSIAFNSSFIPMVLPTEGSRGAAHFKQPENLNSGCTTMSQCNMTVPCHLPQIPLQGNKLN